MDLSVLKLKNLNILDTPEEDVFNEIVKSASSLCDAPISLITLLDSDRQWFKAKTGVDINETPKAVSFCSHSVSSNHGQLIVEDLTKDERFRENPFVTGEPNIKSYAGINLVTSDGFSIGTVCVLDKKTREFSDKQLSYLQSLAKVTIKLIEERTHRIELQTQNKILKTLNTNLESFSYKVAHDVKAPLRNMSSFSSLLKSKLNDKLSTSEFDFLSIIENSAQNLSAMVDNLLEFSKKIQIGSVDFELICTSEMITEVISDIDSFDSDIKYIIDPNLPTIFTSKVIFRQTIQNILSNSVKYSKGKGTGAKVEISYFENDLIHEFIIEDNGIGIDQERLKEIFELFNSDSREKNSSGVGLCIVKELLERINGVILIESTLNIGTKSIIRIPKSAAIQN